MNYFLILIIMGLCGGGYYEYTQLQTAQQDKLASDQQQIDKLQADNKKLTDDSAQTRGHLADLARQLQTAQSNLALAQKAAASVPPPAAAPSPAPSPGGPAPTDTGNDLGTIAALDGQTFQNCQLLKVDADGITVNHTQGITKIVFGLLPPALQKRFGYDPHQAAALTEAQIEYQEEQRKAAADQTAGH